MPLLIIFLALFVLPDTYDPSWKPKYQSPGIISLLSMTEIVFGAISVALLIGEPFGIRKIILILFTTDASMHEPLLELSRPNTNFDPNC